MVFSSYIFIFAFLPIVLIGYFLLSKTKSTIFQHLFVLISSLVFYSYMNLSYLPVILVSIVVNYVLARLILTYRDRQPMVGAEEIIAADSNASIRYSRWFLLAGIVFNVGMLSYFKYYDFFVANLNVVLASDFVLRTILLPLGISFFVFQQLLYLLGVYKGSEEVETLLDYALFVTFFPKLVAGPIAKYSLMMPNFHAEKHRFINYDNLAAGIYIFCIGLFKKVVIADSIALFANNGFAAAELSCAAAWATALSYTFQIYFDFSGYSDMAIGLGKMFNIQIPVNFNSPYKSASVSEFWHRWHMTLSQTLGELIYIPLGGNRQGLPRTCVNLLLTFFISGLWHGAAWTFVLWGTLHGVLVVIERIFKRGLEKIPHGLRIAATFLCINGLWVLFRAASFDNAMMVFKGMFDFRNIGFKGLSTLASDGIVGLPASMWIAYTVLVLLALLIIVFRGKNSVELTTEFRLNNKTIAVVVLLFAISVVHLSRLSTFVYFNF